MPGYITHHVFGLEGFHKMNANSLKNVIKKHFNVYMLGMQGPDIFFFYLPFNMISKKNLGLLLHEHRINDFFSNLFDALAQLETAEGKEIGFAYIAGYLGHYILDTVCHPYVYAKTGREKRLERVGRHFSLEADIDAQFLPKYTGSRPAQFNPLLSMRISGQERQVISGILCPACNRTYDGIRITPRTIKRVLRFMRTELFLLRDKRGFKGKIFYIMEKAILGYPYLSSKFFNDFVRSKDACNEMHKIWKNPWDPTIASSQSVYEMFQDALIHYQKFLPYLEDALLNAENGYCIDPSIFELIGNRSCHSGLACGS